MIRTNLHSPHKYTYAVKKQCPRAHKWLQRLQSRGIAYFLITGFDYQSTKMALPTPPTNETFGTMLICALVSMGLYGITTLQTYFYFLNYGYDRISMKALVGVVWALDTIHSALMCFTIYQYLIIGYAQPEILESGVWSLFGSMACNIIVAFISQCFFTKRIHILSPPRFKLLISVPIACIVVCHFVVTVIQFFKKKQFALLNEGTNDSVIPFGVLAVFSDILIALALVLLLRQNHPETEETKSLIKKLVVYAINRCILTSYAHTIASSYLDVLTFLARVIAAIEIALFMSFPGSVYSFAFDFIIGKLYVNSLLASLNSRKSLRGNKSLEIGGSIPFSTALRFMSAPESGTGGDESLTSVGSADVDHRVTFHGNMDSKTDSTGSTGSKRFDARRRSMDV
ncbi:hypothetical protein BDP27DRAFT_1447835 [Rhodocollybia butyracea]|uniref:DUF6534 domain-containing protein n=1 Tax=Rhodocollybia butyracea TaxID=206335 RepID=A0A9P5PU86_9AGAR|nr:hypothetical protein BDP27DRAFT_1447835 [Rhodocollybia butyracea]